MRMKRPWARAGLPFTIWGNLAKIRRFSVVWFLAMPKEWDRRTESLLDPESCRSRLGRATLCSCPRSKLAEYREVSSRCVSIADGSRW